MTDQVFLVLNIGSSSIKFAVVGATDGAPLARGLVQGIGVVPRLTARFGTGSAETVVAPADEDTQGLTRWLLGHLQRRLGRVVVKAAGHRVVHGGAGFAGPAVVTPEVMAALTALSPLAPAHQPYNLAGIRAVAALWPGVVQVACFDTSFHRSLPRLAQIYALPRALSDEGILRYGFHGLSYDHIARVMGGVIGAAAQGRVIVAHLGSGASLCAMVAGQSVETTMGFSALEGLVMGTRAGQIDPGVILHLMRTNGMDAAAIETLLGKQSGLLGVSGLSPDMRDLLASPDPRAAEAVDLFTASVLRHIGGLVAGMGGLDALIFTAGIGEHSPVIRGRIMARLSWLGVVPDDAANDTARRPTILTQPQSRVTVAMIPADEEAVLLRALQGVIGA